MSIQEECLLKSKSIKYLGKTGTSSFCLPICLASLPFLQDHILCLLVVISQSLEVSTLWLQEVRVSLTIDTFWFSHYASELGVDLLEPVMFSHHCVNGSNPIHASFNYDCRHFLITWVLHKPVQPLLPLFHPIHYRWELVSAVLKHTQDYHHRPSILESLLEELLLRKNSIKVLAEILPV